MGRGGSRRSISDQKKNVIAKIKIPGISFPDSKQMKEWKQFQEEAAKRDHRKLGRVREREINKAGKLHAC